MGIRPRALLRIVLLGIAIGFAVGLGGAIFFISTNRYVDYGMFRLAISMLQRFQNTTVPIFVTLVLVLRGFLLLPMQVSPTNQNRFLRFGIMVILVVIAIFVIRWFAVPMHSLRWWIGQLAVEFWRCVGGESAVSDFLSFVKDRLIAGSILVACVVMIIAMWWVVSRIDWRSILESLERCRLEVVLLPIIIALVALNMGVLIDSRVNAPQGFSVILIGIDTWRADHVSGYGYDRLTTPQIDGIADRDAIFTKAFSTTSWTLPSFHSILTSLYQSSHGVIDGMHKLSDSHITLAELLKNQGYQTGGFISGTYLKRSFGFDQGFDLYRESVTSAALTETYADITSPKLTELVVPWIRKNKHESFFLFIHYWDPHFDYIPPAPYDKIFDPHYTGDIDGTDFQLNNRINPGMDRRDLEHVVALYDGEIRWTDSHIGKIFATLEELDLMDQSIIVLVGDHGEEFFEHGQKGHRSTLYNEVIHVPLIFLIPGIEGFKTFNTTVSTVDIVPTILDVLNLESPGRTDGESLMRIIKGERSLRQAGAVYSELAHNWKALIKDGWKIIHNSDSGECEIYDLRSDFCENLNVIGDQPEVAASLRAELAQWIRSQQTQRIIAPRAHQDSETKRQLKALGYVQ